MRIIRRICRSKKITITAIISALVLINHVSHGAIKDILLRPAPVAADPPGTWNDHPVMLLHQDAGHRFDEFIRRQSKSPDEAELEYKRRYGKQPPPGFRQWVDYAIANGSPVIDDFDFIAEGVHPFLKYAAAEIESRVSTAISTRNGDHVGICQFAETRFGTGCRTMADALTQLLGPARKLIPDVKLLINFLDEPSELLGKQGTGNGGSTVPWADLSHHSIAAAVAEACDARGREPRVSERHRNVERPEIHFVTNITTQRDLCQHPEYASQHGFIASPATLQRLPSEVPILSRASSNPFSDILYPATHYSLPSSLYKPWHDLPWNMKKNAVYWTGSSTGGEWSHDSWRKGHRQRLVALAAGLEHRNYTLLRRVPDNSPMRSHFQPYTTNAINLSLFDVGFTRIVGCASASVCDEQMRFFGSLKSLDPDSRPMRYRFALDVDGNSFSGRFYRFLASRSVPLKLSIFREWHDERLQPWLHYVPLSAEMGELPELVRFLTSTVEGQWVSRRIAEAGRTWYFQAITKEHQGIYFYRLMLELARLYNTSRDLS